MMAKFPPPSNLKKARGNRSTHFSAISTIFRNFLQFSAFFGGLPQF
jgi:hypothetical protein